MIAEGLRAKSRWSCFRIWAATYGQGYYFYHPMPIEVFEQILSDEHIDFRESRRDRLSESAFRS